MPVQSKLVAQQASGCGGSARRIAAKRHLACDHIAVQGYAKGRQDDCKVVADIVHVLLSVDKFVEGDDAVVAEELLSG